MEGVVLFADDHIHNGGSGAEKALFESLREELPVLGVHTLELAEEAVSAIGSFSALILDWDFSVSMETEEDEEEKKELKLRNIVAKTSTEEEATLRFLEEKDFYSLIYIFSTIDVEGKYGDRLRKRFGDRVRFKKKAAFKAVDAVKVKREILSEIETWKAENENLSIPIRWSSAINGSIQKIFKELSEAEANWLKELYDSASKDGVDPELFVVEILQLVLSEQIVQDKQLVSSIRKIGQTELDTTGVNAIQHRKSLSKLFSRLYYSKLESDAPIMTGDVFKIQDSKYGVLITPECDIKEVGSKEEAEFEFLTFDLEGMVEELRKSHSFNRTVDDIDKWEKGKPLARKERIRQIFNNGDGRLHYLPSMPLISNGKSSVVVDFRWAGKRIKTAVAKELARDYKINSPFIQQLRQRYLAYVGRVGTPALPTPVRDWNLSFIPPETKSGVEEPSTAYSSNGSEEKKTSGEPS